MGAIFAGVWASSARDVTAKGANKITTKLMKRLRILKLIVAIQFIYEALICELTYCEALTCEER